MTEPRNVKLHERRDLCLCNGSGLMIVVGVVVMMLVVGVLCLREVEVDSLRVVCFMVEGDIFALGGGFMTIVVAVEVENLEGRVVSLVL